jgi:tetratricopeptide (TPR) repeat protein
MPPLRDRRPRSSGFILLFGSRNMIRADPAAGSVQTVCPKCQQMATMVGKVFRPWFTIFFIPVFPIGGRQRFTECMNCHAQFRLPVQELERRAGVDQAQEQQRSITMYNSLRASPANSITLNELMQLYGQMGEYDQAVSAARDFPEALRNSEQCMSTLGRVLLAAGRNAEAVQWFDAALARNPQLAEAQYHKAVACLTAAPPRVDEAVAAARAARNAGYPRAEQLLREAEGKARESASEI